MQPRAPGDWRALERALDQVDPPARGIEVVAEDLVGRAGRGAKPAMHALAQDLLGLRAIRTMAHEIGKLGLHDAARYTLAMGTAFNLLALALLIACIAWAWVSVRNYAERKRSEEARAAAFLAETVSALKKTRTPAEPS